MRSAGSGDAAESSAGDSGSDSGSVSDDAAESPAGDSVSDDAAESPAGEPEPDPGSAGLAERSCRSSWGWGNRAGGGVPGLPHVPHLPFGPMMPTHMSSEQGTRSSRESLSAMRAECTCVRVVGSSSLVTHEFFEGLRPTLHIAHRGGAALAPENTLLAFQAAVEVWRTDVIELDVHVTGDGEVVVAHDPQLDRCTDGTGTIAERTWGEIASLDAGWAFSSDGDVTHPFRGTGARIPRLAEVLEALPSVRLNIDCKPVGPGPEERLAAVVRQARAEARVCVGSEHHETALRLARALPEACHFFPGRALVGAILHLRGQLDAPPEGPWTVLDMPLHFGEDRLVDRGFIDRATARGLWVNVWTVDERPEMERLVAEGVGGIMTDRPDLLRAVLDERA